MTTQAPGDSRLSEATLPTGPDRVAERLLEAIRAPFRIAGVTVPISITASIGIAVGDDSCRQADRCRKQIELLRLQSPVKPPLSAGAVHQHVFAFSLSDNLTGMRHAVPEMEALSRSHPGLAPFVLGDDPSAWLAAQSTIAVGLALDDPRPRRGTLLGLALGGADGRLLVAGPDDAERRLAAVASVRAPLAGHDVKRVLVAELARRDPAGTAGPR